MLSITKKADYGLIFLHELAHNPPENYLPLKKIAKNANLPYKFLSQIAIELKSGGVVESKEGLGGGYRLHGSPKKITVGRILSLLDGPMAPVGCLRGKSCGHEKECAHKKVMEKLAQAFEATMGKFSLADLAH
jgi:Rrf2 family transcriptional regulator, cysteine metabolism repressor